MESFNLKLAGVVIGVNCQYNSTKEYCRDYFTDTAPCFSVSVSSEDIEAEKPYFSEERSPGYLEKLALYRKICEGLVEHGIFLLHGSAVAVDGEVYIFVAPSGTGKSTHTALWRKLLVPLGHEVVMVNDDKPLIRVADGRVFACGTPWNGAHRLSENVSLPVKAICVLERGTSNCITEITSAQAFAALYRFSFRPKDHGSTDLVLGMLEEVMRCVRFYRLKCDISTEAAEISYNMMK